jgi:hypothetical protein
LTRNSGALIELLRRHIQALWHHVEFLESALKVGPRGDIVVKGTKIEIVGTGSVTINSGGLLALSSGSTLSLSGLSIAASAGKVDFKTGHLTSSGNKIPTQDEVQAQIKDARHRVVDTVSRAMQSGADPAAVEAQEETLQRRELLKSRPAP